MSTFLSKELQKGLDDARASDKRRKSRFRVQFDGDMYPVLKMWDSGFSVESDRAPQMRGLVDLFDGARHLSRCLIVASDEENGELAFEFKRSTPVKDKAPTDFPRIKSAPIALLN
jgi:hypothetical protein